jgi:chromosomal replication initiator protein
MMETLWEACTARLQKELPSQQFNTWIRPLRPGTDSIVDNELALVAPNRFVLQWIKDRFVPKIEALASELAGHPVRLSLGLPEVEAPIEPLATTTTRSQPKPTAPIRAKLERSNLIGEFTFEGFVPGKANQLARAAAIQVAENPGTSYNPLFIYGGVGLG